MITGYQVHIATKMVVFFVLKQFCFDNSNSIIMTIRGSDFHLLNSSVLLLYISYHLQAESFMCNSVNRSIKNGFKL